MIRNASLLVGYWTTVPTVVDRRPIPIRTCEPAAYICVTWNTEAQTRQRAKGSRSRAPTLFFFLFAPNSVSLQLFWFGLYLASQLAAPSRPFIVHCPDPQVQSLAISGDATYAGTATGVAEFNGGHFSRVLAPGVMATALLATATQLYVGSENQGVVQIPLEGRHPNPNRGPSAELSEVRQLFMSGESVFAVARDGLYRMNPRAFGWQRVLETGSTVLTDRNISALAADSTGRIWVGYFDRGLDLLPADGRVTHTEDERVFCVNRILPDAKAGAIDVATANGLVRFDNSGSAQQVLTRADGLIADHVTDVAAYRDGLALAHVHIPCCPLVMDMA